jgi:hypothetical protein
MDKVKRLAYALLISGCSMYASPILVTSPSNLNMTDVLDWSQFGGDKTSLLQSNFYGSTNSLIGSSFTEMVSGKFTNGGGTILDAGVDAGQGTGMSANDALLSTNTAGKQDGISLSFAPTYGIGAYLEVPGAGAFTARIEAFSGLSSVLTASVDGVAGNDVFLGVLDTKADITRVVYSLTTLVNGLAQTSTSNFIMDSVFFQNTALAPAIVLPPLVVTAAPEVPEPGMMSLMALGFAGLVWKFRKRAKV